MQRIIFKKSLSLFRQIILFIIPFFYNYKKRVTYYIASRFVNPFHHRIITMKKKYQNIPFLISNCFLNKVGGQNPYLIFLFLVPWLPLHYESLMIQHSISQLVEIRLQSQVFSSFRSTRQLFFLQNSNLGIKEPHNLNSQDIPRSLPE